MYESAQHRLIEACAWRPDDDAIRINDHLLMSKGTSNSYLVASPGGDVVINTGTSYQGERHRERYETLLQRPLRVEKILFTQSHPDHIGGWSAFNDPSAETIAQEQFAECRLDRTLLNDYFPRRSRRLVGDLQPSDQREPWFRNTLDPEVTTLFAKTLDFEVDGRRFELHGTPGGETLDSCVLWLPAERTAFIGNMMGALFGALPALYTPRGDRLRSARQFIASVNTVLSLAPEVLVTGHEDPIVGQERVRTSITKVRDAVQFIHDYTVAGMNEGKNLFTLMAEIELPPDLHPEPGRGPARWYVRAIWEEYSGWFRFESTTELYAVPQRAVWGEMAALMGGVEPLAKRAQQYVETGQPVEALHLTDIALAVDPSHGPSLQAQIGALLQLIERTGGEPHDELRWLESELGTARELSGETSNG